jgi:hypothetical protein
MASSRPEGVVMSAARRIYNTLDDAGRSFTDDGLEPGWLTVTYSGPQPDLQIVVYDVRTTPGRLGCIEDAYAGPRFLRGNRYVVRSENFVIMNDPSEVDEPPLGDFGITDIARDLAAVRALAVKIVFGATCKYNRRLTWLLGVQDAETLAAVQAGLETAEDSWAILYEAEAPATS